MADVELLPLPEHFAHQSERVKEHVRAYARANLAPLQAENERLRSDLRDYMQAANAEAARAERLAEVLRDARRSLAFAAQHLPECNEPYERANDALAQEDRNG